jgi:small subunit ribosomal protein S9
MEVIHTIGRRKTSVARLYISKGKGNITVNRKAYNEFFPTATLQYKIIQPLALTENEGKFDLKLTVKGGGYNGQAEAVRLAISRALCKIDEENRSILKPEGLLTRDPRMVERKKFGQKKSKKKNINSPSGNLSTENDQMFINLILICCLNR